MSVRSHGLGLALSVLLVGLSFATSVGYAAGEFSVANQGWGIVEEAGKRSVELRALVANHSKSPLVYEVRFVVESKERPPQGKRSNQPGLAEGQSTDPAWPPVHTVSVRGGPLGPGASALVRGIVPYDLLVPGKAFRYRAQLINLSDGMVMGTAIITSLARPFPVAAVAAGVAGAAALIAKGGAPSASVSGSGTMVGQHEAHRAGNEWVEHGSGTIDVTTPQGRMVLHYSYDSRGPSAGTLRATATATGQLSSTGGQPLPVEITSASARTTVAGTRQQTGSVIRRTGAVATGTFSGTVEGKPWTGALTMTDGDTTLDLSSNTGTHRFNIRFTAGQ